MENTLGQARRALADSIPVRLDEALMGKWEARVEVELGDGRVVSRTRDKAAGQTDKPVTERELTEKLEAAATAALPAGGGAVADRLGALLLDLPRLPSVVPLSPALAFGASGEPRIQGTPPGSKHTPLPRGNGRKIGKAAYRG